MNAIPTPAPVPTPTPAPPRSLQLPSDPQSPYGIALRQNLVDGWYYSEEDKVHVVGNTFSNLFFSAEMELKSARPG